METIITERLILRSPDNNDAQTLLKIHNDMATLKFNAMTKYEFAEMIRDIEREHDMMYCIELKNSNNVIGAVFINTDRLRYRVNALSLSYYLDCRYYRNGYMYEALQAIIIKLFEQEIDIIRQCVGEKTGIYIHVHISFQSVLLPEGLQLCRVGNSGKDTE